jgi:hypothetical protein
MNAFYQHHRDSISWHYGCFDRILLNGLIQPFQQPERVVGFFNTYRRLYPVSRQLLHGIADHFQKWLKGWTEKAKVPVLDAPKGRRDTNSLTPTSRVRSQTQSSSSSRRVSQHAS